jgi:hypothetical protein
MTVAVALFGGAACRTGPGGAVAPGAATLVQFHADSNVRNPGANDAYPGVRRVVVRAVDNRARPDSAIQVTDRVRLAPGERRVLLLAEAESRSVTFSEVVFEAEPGVDYRVVPLAADDGMMLAEIRRANSSERVAMSRPWRPADGKGNAGRAETRPD